MASNTVPVHGKLGALYVLRPNGFSGLGLNDVTWGLAATNAATAYYEVVIDTVGAPDKFKWRKNGGGWTSTVSITGASQTLDEAQTITFAATTGHTLNDQWVIGNLKTEATTEVGADAQITAVANRIINPNAPPVFTDSGGKLVQRINYTNGTATFDGNCTIVTATGNNGFIPLLALRKVGYIMNWTLNVNLDMADISRMGQNWKEFLPGQGGASGSANSYFIPGESLLLCIQQAIAANQKGFFLQLFTWDASQDQTGDHYNVWAAFSSFALNPTIGAVVQEAINFQVIGELSFTADS